MDKPLVLLEGATWLVWSENTGSYLWAAMSKAQFVHQHGPVIAVQRGGRMEYLDEDGEVRWKSNTAWPRANLEMVRLADFEEWTGGELRR
jgi:hypothetical protein